MKDKLLFIFIFIVLTLFNCNKAFHIDDTFHLEAARWIAENPLRPMSGLINWLNDPTPLYSHNQPPLFFYLVALVSLVFGFYEFPMHLMISTFTLLSLFYFMKLTKVLELKSSNILLLLFGFCPALIVNQNVMTDVPILALILGSCYYLLRAQKAQKLRNYLLASLYISLGLLIKYSLLPLLIVIFIVILIRKDYRFLIISLLPILFLLLWSGWNNYEYGSIHILDRPKGGVSIMSLWSYWVGLGSVGLFTLVFVQGIFPIKYLKWLILCLLLSFIGLFGLFFFDLVSELGANNFLRVIFLVLGAIGFLLPFYLMIRYWFRSGLYEMIASKASVLFLYFGALSSFVILFAPFTATRHVLLAVPFIILLGALFVQVSDNSINRIVIFYSIVLSICLAVSDWRYAHFYRGMADQSMEKVLKSSQVWSLGHWGWQWYSSAQGMKSYSTSQSKPKSGDYMIFPVGISRQELNENLHFSSITKLWSKPGPFSIVNVSQHASLYHSSLKNLPWRLSKSPIDTIHICRVK
jgi:4-amino-4-deoxy-L-arabinose transferase-like glycosyltransferase